MAALDISTLCNFYDYKTVSRFASYITIDDITGAWLWNGGISGNGYGVFWYEGKTVSAHRFAYKMVNGEISDYMFVCHKYEELGKHNVNPDHLFLGSGHDNMSDASKKLRLPYGSKNSQSKLTKIEVDAIRVSNETYKYLSNLYNISIAKISNIKRGVSWVNDTNIKKVAIHSLRNKTGFRGVRINNNKKIKSIIFRSAITVTQNGIKKVVDLGCYQDPIEAAKAFDAAAIYYRGDKAKLNFSYP